MRAVSFVKKLQWDLPGTVCRHGLTIGDVDNDGDNELVVGTAEGELYIFKGSELWQKIAGLGLVTSVAIGDIFNYGRNALVVICGDGWAHIFYSPRSVNPGGGNVLSGQQSSTKEEQDNVKTTTGHVGIDPVTAASATTSPSTDQVDGSVEVNELSGKMECVHVQRIPTNTKVVLVADVDEDGANEMILGLTDRVVRSYRWSSNLDIGTGKLVGLNKWECANQIGTVTLQHGSDGTPTLLVAQPGGTFMRIKCNPEDRHLDEESCDANSESAASCVDYQTLGISRMRNQNISTEIIGNLDSKMSALLHITESKTTAAAMAAASFPKQRSDSIEDVGSARDDGNGCTNERGESTSTDQVDGNLVGGNVILGDFDATVNKGSLLPTFKDFCPTTGGDPLEEADEFPEKEKTSDEPTSCDLPGSKPYALATLDGTIMLVKDEVILWAMQVDHQIFALCRLDVTNDGCDEIVACAWDGQTYILDQQQNSVRFQFEEPVRAFCTGKYNVMPGVATPCLVYNTFNNKLFLYYDVTLPSMMITPLNPLDDLTAEEREALEKLLGETSSEPERQKKMQQLTEWLLYGGL